MEENQRIYQKPKYTMSWLGVQCLFVLGLAFVLSLITSCIDGFASSRVESGLLKSGYYALISESIVYCFAVISITSFSLMLVEVAFRKSINYIQYALIAMALALFYLLLLAMSEKLPFVGSYIIVTVMTVGLITVFVKGITHNSKAVGLSAIILVAEYALMFLLIKLGSMALLVGSLSLFVIIAVAMYFTLKLKVIDEELVIK
ncbi:MAG: cell envelope integrity protein CreD [Muribaculaceae bacterium]|nr:cell envelope integrity protein CreD [Muribaculaceae bacterium]